MPKEQKGCCRESKDAKISYQYQKQYYRNIRTERKMYANLSKLSKILK
jgi:hypothetical protein